MEGLVRVGVVGRTHEYFVWTAVDHIMRLLSFYSGCFGCSGCFSMAFQAKHRSAEGPIGPKGLFASFAPTEKQKHSDRSLLWLLWFALVALVRLLRIESVRLLRFRAFPHHWEFFCFDCNLTNLTSCSECSLSVKWSGCSECFCRRLVQFNSYFSNGIVTSCPGLPSRAYFWFSWSDCSDCKVGGGKSPRCESSRCGSAPKVLSEMHTSAVAGPVVHEH